MSKALKQKVLTGSFWSLVSTSGFQVFGLIVFVILSRILTPADFGTVALAIVFVELSNIIARFGLMDVLVREKDESELSRNTVFWTNAGIGALLSLCIYLIAPWMESVFEANGLSDVLRMLCIIPTVYALTAVHDSILLKGFDFKALAYRSLISSGIAGIVSIVMAVKGFGMYSLAFQKLASMSIVFVMVWMLVGWRPKWIFSKEYFKAHTRMGGSLVVSTFLSMGTVRVFEVILGFFLGPAAVGYFKIAGKLHDFVVQFTIRPMVDVALSTFSKLQDDAKALKRAYLRLTQFASLLAFPAFLGLAAIAPDLIVFVFGEKWGTSGVLMQVICIASISSTLNYFFKPLVIASGQPKIYLAVQVVGFISMVLITLVTTQYSLMIAMFGYVVAATIVTITALVMMRKYMNIRELDVLKNMVAPIVSALLMLFAILMVKQLWLQEINIILSLALQVILGVLVYVLSFIVLFRKEFRKTKDAFLPTLRSLKKGKSA